MSLYILAGEFVVLGALLNPRNIDMLRNSPHDLDVWVLTLAVVVVIWPAILVGALIPDE